MPRVLTNKDALRASVSADTRARYADGKPIELVKLPEEAPPAPDRLAEAVGEIKQALEVFAAKVAAKGAVQTPVPVVNTDELVDLLTRIVANTSPRPAAPPPGAKKVRFRVLERDEKGRALVFEVEE